MGASISTLVANGRVHARMLDFLGTNWREYGKLGIDNIPTRLDGNGKTVFDYSGSCGQYANGIGTEYYGHLYGWERLYTTAVLRWVAVKIGRKRLRFSREVLGSETISAPAPYLIYDSEEYWPIFVTTFKEAVGLPQKLRQWSYDRLGCYHGPETSESVVQAAKEHYLWHNKARYEAFQKDVKTLGPKPDESVAHRAWLDKIDVLAAKHCKPEIERVLPILRAELERLDDLWKLCEYARGIGL
jgi:hypothetical protein